MGWSIESHPFVASVGWYKDDSVVCGVDFGVVCDCFENRAGYYGVFFGVGDVPVW